jgi:hypothetical protein
MSAPTKQEIHDYLIALRDSGEVNMWGAAPYLEREFRLPLSKAREALLVWMSDMMENEK